MNAHTPLSPASMAAPRSAAWMEWKGSGRVLVIEDDAAVRMLVTRALPKLGFTAAGAGSGAEALALMRALPEEYVLILSDLSLPGMEAAEMIRGIRDLRPEIALILMTGYPRERIREKMGDIHVNGFVPKPFTLDTLAAEIRSVLAP